MIKRWRNEVDMHFWRVSRGSRKKETLHGQKDLIKTSLLHEIIKEISSSNGQSHATKKNIACNVKRRRKDKKSCSDEIQPIGCNPQPDRLDMCQNDQPIGWRETDRLVVTEVTSFALIGEFTPHNHLWLIIVAYLLWRDVFTWSISVIKLYNEHLGPRDTCTTII